MRRLLLLPAFVLVAVGGTAAAAPTACPARHQGRAMNGGQVFDGPPEELADLRPDTDRRVGRERRATWNVASVYKAGRQVHLLCYYDGNTAPITVKAPHPVKVCVYRTDLMWRGLSLRCD